MNVADLLLRTTARQPDRPALLLGADVTSYAELAEAAARVAALLAAAGVGPGDRVGVMLPNVPQFAAIYYGVLRAGAVVVPMNPLLKAREIGYYLADSGARLLFAWHTAAGEARAGAGDAALLVVDPDTFAALLAPHAPADGAVRRAGDDTAVILYTSGTTGRPKGAELTHANLTRNAEVTLGDLLRLSPDDRVFGGLPLFHSFGQTVTLNAAMASGASLLLLPRFDAATALDLMATNGATVFAGVPTMYSAMLGVADAPALPALRVCVSGGAALPVEVLHAFEARFGCVVLEGYGLSETSPVASFNRPDGTRKPGTIGTPVTGVSMRVVDGAGRDVEHGAVGEIAIRGHNVMKGYWHKPEATAEVLYEHPDVAEAAVIGIAHATLGEEVGAAVALKPGATVTETELRDHVKRQVAAYKYPRVVWFVDALPKGPTGKVLKREIVPPASVQKGASA